MRLHLLAVPHTVTHPDWSHCAYTQKVRRMAPMMHAQGFEVIHYGNEGSAIDDAEHVEVMRRADMEAHLGQALDPHTTRFFQDHATAGSPLYRQWNLNARALLADRVEPGDLILLPFGHAHDGAIRGLPVLANGAGAIESGVGYFDCLLPWRVYESYAVRHAVMAKEGRYGVQLEGARLEVVVPNFYDLTEWPQGPGGPAVVCMGRLTEGKGVPIVLAMARANPHVPFVLAGQGDPLAFGPLPDNVHYVGPVVGRKRAELLGNALAVVAPSRYIEPFGGVVIEAALCGTPAITSDFGCFCETVLQGITGVRCSWMRDFAAAVDGVRALDRRTVRRRAQRLYSMERVGARYAEVFRRASDAACQGLFQATGW